MLSRGTRGNQALAKSMEKLLRFLQNGMLLVNWPVTGCRKMFLLIKPSAAQTHRACRKGHGAPGALKVQLTRFRMKVHGLDRT